MAKKKVGRRCGGSRPAAVLARTREEKAIAMRLEGATLQQIADAVGYATPTGAWLALNRALAQIPQPEKVDELRQREIALLNQVEQEATEGWQRSSLREDGGNPAFLDKILKVSERRAKLLGLDAPQKFQDVPSQPPEGEEALQAARKLLEIARKEGLTG